MDQLFHLPATPTCTVSNANQTATGTISGITVQDLRGSGAGYSVTTTFKNFSTGSAVLPICETVACAASRLSVTPSALAISSGEPSTVNTLGLTDYTST